MRSASLIGVVAAAGVIAGGAAPARGDAATTQAAMETYFEGEQRGGYVLIGMGAAGLASGAWLYTRDSQVARGASYPLLGVGVAHVAAGIFVNLASRRRVDTFTDEIAADHDGFVARERPRMAGVSRTFTGLKIAEVILIAGGLGTAAFAWRADRPRLEGAGLAVAAEAALTLGFDIFAARRATRYRDALADAGVTASFATDPGTTVFVLSGRF